MALASSRFCRHAAIGACLLATYLAAASGPTEKGPTEKGPTEKGPSEHEAAGPVGAATAVGEGERAFVLQVQRLLQEKCVACHGKDPEAIEGGLDVRSREALLAGGESGEPILKPGDASASALYTVLTDDHAFLSAMPPKENDRLSEEQAWAFRDWIDAGAPWPDVERVETLQAALQQELNRGRQVQTSGGMSESWSVRRYEPQALWAYRPLDAKVPPQIDGSASAVDAFIDARLAELELEPAAAADRATLARRASFDLLGLPPEPGALTRYLEDPRPHDLAFSRYLDRLLANPHFGEQAARHWLDVTRYADSAGFANDYERPNAWRYRDYVVRAMNADKSYADFVREQIAGDEIDPEDPEHLVAVGFLRMGPWEQTGMSVAKVTRQQFLDDVTDNVGQVFLGHALQCARCHDHKFDPVPTRDYYRMQAVFATTQFATRPAPFLEHETTAGFSEAAYLRERIERYQAILEEIDAKHERAARRWYAERGLEYAPRNQKRKAGVPEDELVPKTYGLAARDNGMERIARKYITRHRWELERYQPKAFSVYSGGTPSLRSVSAPLRMPERPWQAGTIEPVAVLAGGDPFSPTVPVTPGVLSAVPVSADATHSPAATADGWKQIPASPGGRREALADWLVDPRNPLPARVIVNRLWQQAFGQGLAANPNNFGTTGNKPTHPALLDWLASGLQQQDWSMKWIRRQLLNTAAYRRGSVHPDPQRLSEQDPLGRFLAVTATRRLAAEELRDAMLVASRSLNRQLGGIPVRPDINREAALQPRMIMGTYAPAYQPNPQPGQRNRRSLYALRLRGLSDPAMDVFNQPVPDASCERRSTSTVTPQALTLMNGRRAIQRAASMAAHLHHTAPDAAPAEQIARAFEWTLGRAPDATEEQWVLEHLVALQTRHQQLQFDPEPPLTSVTRRAVDELTGETFAFTERLEQREDYVREPQYADLEADIRALADVCLVLLNSNEFIYID